MVVASAPGVPLWTTNTYFLAHSRVFYQAHKPMCAGTNQQNFNLTAQGLLEDFFWSILDLLRGDSMPLAQNVLAIDLGATNVNDNVYNNLDYYIYRFKLCDERPHL